MKYKKEWKIYQKWLKKWDYLQASVSEIDFDQIWSERLPAERFKSMRAWLSSKDPRPEDEKCRQRFGNKRRNK